MSMLSSKATTGIYSILQLGCFIRFIPYKWNSTLKQLKAPASFDLKIFHFHKNLMFLYTHFMAFRLMQASKSSTEKPPLQQMLLSVIWTNAFAVTCVAIFQVDSRREELMQLANRLLALIQGKQKFGNDDYGATFPKILRIEKNERENRSWHIHMAVFLLYTNPTVHSLIQYGSMCAPNFFSSVILPCRSIGDNMHSFLSKSPFVVLEFYAIFIFLYVCCFNWTLILIGLSHVKTELKKMLLLTAEGLSRFEWWHSIHHRYRQLELIVIIVNDLFYFYLGVFPTILLSDFALLLFGAIRLWHVSPQTNLMFPLCGAKCAFEALSPLAMAGNVNKYGKLVLTQWKQITHHVLRQQTDQKDRKIFQKVQSSCKRIQCTAGSLFSFENSIVLCCINNCVDLTVNLLVTFGADQ